MINVCMGVGSIEPHIIICIHPWYAADFRTKDDHWMINVCMGAGSIEPHLIICIQPWYAAAFRTKDYHWMMGYQAFYDFIRSLTTNTSQSESEDNVTEEVLRSVHLARRMCLSAMSSQPVRTHSANLMVDLSSDDKMWQQSFLSYLL